MKRKILVLVVVWTLLTCSVVAAQSRESGIVTIGYTHGIGDRSFIKGPAVSAAVFVGLSKAISLGLSIGYDDYGRERRGAENWQAEFRRHMLAADLSCRIRKPSGTIRPYATIGGGISIWKENEKMRWVVGDASGSVIYEYSSSGSHAEPLMVLGAGIDFPKVLGALGVGINVRYRLTLNSEGEPRVDKYLTISVGVSIN